MTENIKFLCPLFFGFFKRRGHCEHRKPCPHHPVPFFLFFTCSSMILRSCALRFASAAARSANR